MATVAAGRACPNDGTLVTCVGQDTDEILVGTCPIDHVVVEMANANRIALEPSPVAAGVAPETHAAAIADLATANARIAELEAELAAARAALGEPKDGPPQGASTGAAGG